jgi:hypothetical protein
MSFCKVCGSETTTSNPRVRVCLKCRSNIRKPGDRSERDITMAHHSVCTCGGSGPGEGCSACNMWHLLYPANTTHQARAGSPSPECAGSPLDSGR